MVETILTTPLFTEVILPFLLVFVIVFALLEKTKILGDGKRQIDAIVSLVIGLIVISFGFATNVISSLMPVLAVSIVVILIFMLLYGMTFKEGEFDLPKQVKGLIGVLAAIVVVVALMVATGAWAFLEEWFYTGANTGSIIANSIIVIVIAVAMAAVFFGGKSKSKDK